MSWKVVYDFLLAAAFLLAAHKIMRAALEGRKQIRVFRYFGAFLAFAWATFFVAHSIDLLSQDIIPNSFWDVTVRVLTTSVAVMFLVWGFLFNERNWSR